MKINLHRITSLLLALTLALGLAVPALAVEETDHVTSVAITPAGPESIPVGKTRQLSASVSYAESEAKADAVSWSSTQDAVATVSGTGLVTARAVGTATIVATARDAGKDGQAVSALYTVTVTEPDPAADSHRLVLGAANAIETAGRYLDKTLTAPTAAVRGGEEEDVTDQYILTYTWKTEAGEVLGTGRTQVVTPIQESFQLYTCQVTAASRNDSTKTLTASCSYRVQVLPTTITAVTVNVNDGAQSLGSLTDEAGRTFLSQLLFGGEDLTQTPAIADLERVVFDLSTTTGGSTGVFNAVNGEGYYADESVVGRHLSELTFTPAGSATGLYQVDFLAYAAAGTVYYGRLEIVITGQTVTLPMGSDVTCDSAGISFSGSDFYRSSDADPVVAVTFGAPEQGKLLRGPLGQLTADDGARYYTNSARDGLYHVSTVTYLPKAGFRGDDLLPLTLITRSGRSIPAALTVHVRAKTASDYFGDVTADGSGTWAANAIDFAFGSGWVNGVSEDAFAPDSQMTRAMLVTVLYRAAGSPAVTGDVSFTDLAQGSYYYNAVVWAASEQVVNGTSETTFSPDSPVSREQIAVILHRYANTLGEEAEVTGTLDAFADKDKVSDYALDSIRWAVAKGIISGMSGENGTTILAPQSSATRAQVVVMLHRWLTNF